MTNKRKRITLIGPVYPYKGGISHYTSLLCRALQKQYRVQLLSFSFQYPKVLYHHEQKDYADDALRIDKTEYVIHTANPLNWPQAAARILHFHPDLVILEWWHPYFAPCYCGILNQLHAQIHRKGLSQPQILFLCHNVFPHERFPLDRLLTEKTLRKGSLYLVQSGRDAADLVSIIPHARFRQTVHPTYDVFHFGNYTRQSSREALGIANDQKVLLFFGFVREYKGLKYLLQALPAVIRALEAPSDRPVGNAAPADTSGTQNSTENTVENGVKGGKVLLIVAGDFSSPESRQGYQAQIQRLGIGAHVLVKDGYIPDKEIEKYFLASDLVVCPYTDATQSGIVQIAYGFDLPVVATRVGGLPDVVEDGKTGYLVEKEDTAQLADAIIRFLKDDREASRMQENIKAAAWKFSWEHLVEIIGELAGFGRQSEPPAQ